MQMLSEDDRNLEGMSLEQLHIDDDAALLRRSG